MPNVHSLSVFMENRRLQVESIYFVYTPRASEASFFLAIADDGAPPPERKASEEPRGDEYSSIMQSQETDTGTADQFECDLGGIELDDELLIEFRSEMDEVGTVPRCSIIHNSDSESLCGDIYDAFHNAKDAWRSIMFPACNAFPKCMAYMPRLLTTHIRDIAQWAMVLCNWANQVLPMLTVVIEDDSVDFVMVLCTEARHGQLERYTSAILIPCFDPCESHGIYIHCYEKCGAVETIKTHFTDIAIYPNTAVPGDRVKWHPRTVAEANARIVAEHLLSRFLLR